MRKGQALVEVMIALLVLTSGFIGILSLLAQSIHLSKTVNNETIASYLASEGIELAKSATDHDIYQHLAGFSGWARGVSDPTFPSAGVYQFDYTWCEGVPYGSSCGQAPLAPTPPNYLRLDPATGLYSYAGPQATPYTRQIIVTPVGTDELIVRSVVTWDVGLSQQSVSLEDYFYAWQP
jgi:hypothetical protein